MRVALGIEYNGARYSGWQRQSHVSSIQAEIETALSRICNHPVDITCAGRTDAGVHATGQVVHFDTHAERDMGAFTLGMNSQLPDDIAVRYAMPTADDFHARFSATARRYRYVIYNHPYRPGILRSGVTHYHHPLDETRMQAACAYMLGEQDFTSFRAVHCQSNTPFRNIHHLFVERVGDYIVVDIKANAFLHHMVRNITGCLMDIGVGEQEPQWMQHLLAIKDRTQASATAKPNGLYLVDVDYPEQWQIPSTPLGPLFLPDNEPPQS
ncbi:tRNA pseudouridine(38-40) synthase TruA [Pseudoalteromonas ruthenica]|uniref:tRNA pseudouridine(38-40) synthase TruA n=1 Tax=Pseudoalteromonas ruthenica TaxID=151081 RepID=UPI0024200D90|nr:tRNA pseudouridine(38-40) synthase TruA [Pseudoalteromonas ruthenica]|tara:strand:+ start:2282 stop:3085 length:804 start_codon:yes stop_codon:yes gene_type:complete